VELAAHLGAILDSEALRLTLSTSSRQRALEKYSLDIYAGKYLQLYQSLAPHAPREPALT
jgi:glycosyltransferase involved in cell wall biosynthesis